MYFHDRIASILSNNPGRSPDWLAAEITDMLEAEGILEPDSEDEEE